jgi:small subunit ribosomal protein S8
VDTCEISISAVSVSVSMHSKDTFLVLQSHRGKYMVQDPISDFIVRLVNAGAVKKASILLPHSALKQSIAETLEKAGFVGVVEKKGKKVKKTLEVGLLYKEDGSPRISGVKRISKPGRRMYTTAGKIVPVRYGYGNLILSTPKGILTDKEARKENVGGESLFEIW